jgi:hypothetical protein
VGLVFGQHDRPFGQPGDGLAQGGEDLVAVGVAAGDQPRSPPGRHLTDPSVQGAQAHGGPAELLPQPGDGPCSGLGQQPAKALAKLRGAQAGSARPGEVAKAVGAGLV